MMREEKYLPSRKITINNSEINSSSIFISIYLIAPVSTMYLVVSVAHKKKPNNLYY